MPKAMDPDRYQMKDLKRRITRLEAKQLRAQLALDDFRARLIEHNL